MFIISEKEPENPYPEKKQINILVAPKIKIRPYINECLAPDPERKGRYPGHSRQDGNPDDHRPTFFHPPSLDDALAVYFSGKIKEVVVPKYPGPHLIAIIAS
jgi:hypothetical protein